MANSAHDTRSPTSTPTPVDSPLPPSSKTSLKRKAADHEGHDEHDGDSKDDHDNAVEVEDDEREAVRVQETLTLTSTPNTRSRAQAKAARSSTPSHDPKTSKPRDPNNSASAPDKTTRRTSPRDGQEGDDDDNDEPNPDPQHDINLDPHPDLNLDPHPDAEPALPADVGANQTHILCPQCGVHVDIRDEETGGFTVRMWEEHREGCFPQTAPRRPPTSLSSSHPSHSHPPSSHSHSHSSSSHPRGQAQAQARDALYGPSSNPAGRSSLLALNALNASGLQVNDQLNGVGVGGQGNLPKKRRAKRTEEERIEYLRNDPYVAQFEAYRVLCASCDKWIRLRPNSTYCSIPWDAHRKSCLAKKINNKNAYALEERNTLFSKDRDIRKHDAERILCNRCDTWLSVPAEDHVRAVQIWLRHRAACDKDHPEPSIPAIPASYRIGGPPSSRGPPHPSSHRPSSRGPPHSSSHRPSSRGPIHGPARHGPESSSRNARPQVPPLSEAHMALASSSSLPSGSSTAVERSPASVSPRVEAQREVARDGWRGSGRDGVRDGGTRGVDRGGEVRGWSDMTPATFSARHGLTHPSAPRQLAAHVALMDAGIYPPRSVMTHVAAGSNVSGGGGGVGGGGGGGGQSHESRRRNAEQRAEALRADPLIGNVEPNRVFCTLCAKWVQLRQDSSFCAYPWVQHRGKCLARFERRAQKTVEVEEFRGQREGRGPEEDELISDSVSSTGGRDADEPIDVDASSSSDAITATGKRIKREADDDGMPFDLAEGPGAAKRRRVDGAPHSPSYRPFHPSASRGSAGNGGGGRPGRPPNYPYSSPYTVDARSGLGHGRPWRGSQYPAASRPGAGSGHANGSTRRSGVEVAEQSQDRGDEDMDADAEGDMDAEGEIEDDEIQVLAHHPAPSTHYRPHVEVHGRGPVSLPFASHTVADSRRGSVSGRRGGPPPPFQSTHHHSQFAFVSHHAHAHAPQPSFSVDLDTPHGRKAFVLHSIHYLFGTTYEVSDEMPISSLLAYVNAAMPVDKYEDFDTGEVSRCVGAGGKEGRGVRLEGDVVRVGAGGE